MDLASCMQNSFLGLCACPLLLCVSHALGLLPVAGRLEAFMGGGGGGKGSPCLTGLLNFSFKPKTPHPGLNLKKKKNKLGVVWEVNVRKVSNGDTL